MRRRLAGIGTGTVLLLMAATAAAQTPGTAVPKFAIDSSPIALHGDVRPHQYLGVIGRAAAWLGTETGRAELWVHPLKLAADFGLSFVIPDYLEPIRGADVARTVTIRPELTTIVYSHATFTVRQHILAPLDERGLLVLLDVETLRPLEIVASFRMVLQDAWPGGFGGQYVFWNGDERTFVLSESTRRRSALIGSPWAAAASEHPAHALPDAPTTFVIPVDTVRARREFIPIAIAAGIEPRDTVVARYHRLLGGAEALYREKLAHVTTLLNETTTLDTPDDELDLAVQWAKVNLDESLTCNPELGCGLVAGWGASGAGERPGFGWFFGGDAAINSFAMDAAGLWDQVALGLRFLARFQRDDGKMPHEISQAAASIPWFTDFPYAYYHADTTPYWLVALWRYWRASGDTALLEDLWPAAERAYRWCLTRETDGDGIIENGPGNLGAIEVGALGEGIHQDIYLAAVWIEALEAMREMAPAMGQSDLAREATALHERASATLHARYWRESDGHHAFGILTSGRTNDNLTVWPATAAAFGLLDSVRADRTLTKLATDSITADWGARILSTGSPLYDPMHYNNGAVWPFVTGFVIWGQYHYRRPWSGYGLVDALKQVTFDWARGRHPELLSGRFYRPLDTAVPQQFFATSMLLSPVVMGLVGWEPDAPDGRARLAPQIPPHWDRVAIRNLRVGPTTLDVEIVQGDTVRSVTVRRRGPPIELELLESLPPGAHATGQSAGAAAGAGAGRLVDTPREVRLTRTQVLAADVTTFVTTWSGGVAVVPPVATLAPGQPSAGLRILEFARDGTRDDAWHLTVEGEADRTYTVRVRTPLTLQVESARVTERAGSFTTLDIPMPAGSGRVVHIVHLSREP
jgi:glycogen debranching enzyme